mmetsp:Transcript_14739/g.25513  ORF Transcript_14739/g.25513 Transcript_14739/m.25513 type:complete len:129 (+) Transcript_14739:381-767(+)
MADCAPCNELRGCVQIASSVQSKPSLTSPKNLDFQFPNPIYLTYFDFDFRIKSLLSRHVVHLFGFRFCVFDSVGFILVLREKTSGWHLCLHPMLGWGDSSPSNNRSPCKRSTEVEWHPRSAQHRLSAC